MGKGTGKLAVLVLLTLLVGLRSQAAFYPHITRSLRQGQNRQAIKFARLALEENPDDSELFAAMGVGFTRTGYFGDAIGVFAFAEGGDTYEASGLEAYADALRYTGEADKAIELRRERLVHADIQSQRELVVWLSLIDDHIAWGDLYGAEESALQALSLFPRSPVLHAYMAQLYACLGDIDNADFHQWMAERTQPTLRGLLVEARRCLGEGNLRCAEVAVQKGQKLRNKSVHLKAMQVEVLRQEGRLDEAMALLNQPKWRLHYYPDLRAAEALVKWDYGQHEESMELLENLLDLYPRDGHVQYAAELRSSEGQ